MIIKIHNKQFKKILFKTLSSFSSAKKSLPQSSCRTIVSKNNTNNNENEINDFLKKFPNVYSQKDCEQFWSNIWHRNELFVNKKSTDSEIDFRLLLPPPNITGSLHLGHSLTVAIQDALCRYYRMNGQQIKWYGGTDHAGIATQIIIEKILWTKYGKTRQNTSREEFMIEFERWKSERIEEIQKQLKSLGASIDFRSDYFTLSPEMSEIVNDAFIQLYNRGMIYRASYMVNWSYYLQSTLSDIEIEHKFISGPTEFKVPGCDKSFQLGVMHYFKYPIESTDSDEFIEIATTRIESIMGDVALCVHPEDNRYTHLIGRFAFNPFTGEKMPIIADQAVKPDFGTGVLKLTPAHSMIDHEIASRHSLPSKNIFNDQGLIDCDYHPLNNVHRYSAKELVRKELETRGLYCGCKDHGHWLPICSRSGDIIESRLQPQWFLKAGDARYAAEFVVNRDNLSDASKEIWSKLKKNLDDHSQNMAIIPSGYRNTWKDWFSRYKDWCISRQIYWGHRIPAYEVIENSKPTEIWIAAKNEEEARKIACEKHGFKNDETLNLRQDEDVLDTWFSSALLPLSVTGWFEGKTFQNGQLPLSLMETGHDIIFFWVARMTLLSLMLSNRLPFNKVLLHGMICDDKGKKMSKSKANVVDPLHLINGASFDELLEQNKQYMDSGLITKDKFTQQMNTLIKTMPKGIPICGADILRLSLLQTRFKEQNVKFELKKAIQKRVFANKMHQTVRFVLMNLDENFQETQLQFDQLDNIDKWILSKLSDLIDRCRFHFNSYDLNLAAKNVENFWINNLCDVYLENIKKDFLDKSDPKYLKSMNVLLLIIRNSLKLIHPFMPFITENLYQKLEFDLNNSSYSYQSILDCKFPDSESDPLLKYFNKSYIMDMDKVVAIMKRIRFFKQYFHIGKDPIIDKIQIASLDLNLNKYQAIIETSMKLNDCKLEFVNLFEIYKYDGCYCLKVDIDEEKQSEIDAPSSSDSESETVAATTEQSNNLESNEIYLLFTLDQEKLCSKLLQTQKFKQNPQKFDEILEELDSIHFKNFTKNYKKLTKIIS